MDFEWHTRAPDDDSASVALAVLPMQQSATYGAAVRVLGVTVRHVTLRVGGCTVGFAQIVSRGRGALGPCRRQRKGGRH